MRVRRAAIVALGKVPGPDLDDARRALIARWDADDVTPDERRALVDAMGKLGGDDVIARLSALPTGTPPTTAADPNNLADFPAALSETRSDTSQPPSTPRISPPVPGWGSREGEPRHSVSERRTDRAADRELVRRRDRALLMAERTARRDEPSAVRIDVAPPAPVTVRLECKPGLALVLAEDLAELDLSGGASPAAIRVANDAVEIALAAPWSALFACRLWSRASIRIPFPWTPPREPATARRADRVEDAGALATAIAGALTAPPVRALLAAWTEGAIRWRLAFARGHKRSVVWRVARDVAAIAPELLNDPTATTWDVEVDDTAATLALVPRRAPDPRFAWRVAEVPAASHPTVAATLARIAGVRDGERVWDPFCGAGAELIECARRARTTSIGSDLDPRALDAARANCAAAEIEATLVEGDARTYVPGPAPVNAIVTNPPLGGRIRGDAARILVEAVPHIARQLAPGGRLVWITPSPKRTTRAAEAAGLVLSRALDVDLGGVRGRLERWDRR